MVEIALNRTAFIDAIKRVCFQMSEYASVRLHFEENVARGSGNSGTNIRLSLSVVLSQFFNHFILVWNQIFADL